MRFVREDVRISTRIASMSAWVSARGGSSRSSSSSALRARRALAWSTHTGSAAAGHSHPASRTGHGSTNPTIETSNSPPNQQRPRSKQQNAKQITKLSQLT